MEKYVVGVYDFCNSDISLFKIEAINECEAVKSAIAEFYFKGKYNTFCEIENEQRKLNSIKNLEELEYYSIDRMLYYNSIKI